MTEKPRDRFAHCGYCGTPFPISVVLWPRRCMGCGETSFRNPIPVVFVLLPTEDRGLLVTRRSIEPGFGLWALTGGYVNFDESIEQAAARETKEETHISIHPHEVGLYDHQRGDIDLLLLFFVLNRMLSTAEVRTFRPTAETSESKIIYEPEELAFKSNTRVVQRYFDERLVRKE